jgi:hypothetical protein
MFRTILRELLPKILKHKNNFDLVCLPIREQTWLFMHEMKMPDEFLDIKSLHAMMLLLFARVSNEEDLESSEFAEILQNFDEIKLSFNTIYKENNISKRLLYFKTPLI